MRRRIIGLEFLVLGILLITTQGGAQVEMDPTLLPKSFLSGKDWRGLAKGSNRPMPSESLTDSTLPLPMESKGPTWAGSTPV